MTGDSDFGRVKLAEMTEQRPGVVTVRQRLSTKHAR